MPRMEPHPSSLGVIEDKVREAVRRTLAIPHADADAKIEALTRAVMQVIMDSEL